MQVLQKIKTFCFLEKFGVTNVTTIAPVQCPFSSVRNYAKGVAKTLDCMNETFSLPLKIFRKNHEIR